MSDIPAGTKIETEMLKLVEVGSYGLPETVVKNTDDIVGKYAKVSMTTDDYLYASKFADYVSDERLDKAVAEGKRLVAVSVPSNAASVANHLKSGERDRAGVEIKLNKHFDWAGHHWIIPAVYSCSKGLVVDFCMRAEAEDIRRFIAKWNLTAENDSAENFTQEQQMQMELENPLDLDFSAKIELNGKTLQSSHGCAVGIIPCLPDGVANEKVAQAAATHYGLDDSYGWMIYSSRFGTTWTADMATGYVGIGYGDSGMTQQVPDEVKAAVEELAAKIASGEIVVETTRA